MPKTPRLREWRERATLSQEELKERSGISRATIADLEAGNRGAQPRTIRRLAAALGVEPADLYGDPDSPKAEAPPSQQLTLNGLLAEERRSLTPADFNAAETFADVCKRLERFLDIAEREPVGAALLNMQHYLIRVAAGLVLPLMEKETFRALVLPTAASFVELARRFEELRESESVTEEEVVQRRELLLELTRRIGEAA
jgi:transcriptional regulator with XRE-family HTH domain